ncbi:P-loop containing nucleoside triphosphate hydrolase protein [Mycena sp. CBHHK59/15]|nr:P-loop containing nucleoside triphosphate hydrolase protein [Mycena sp. CBHHK59/15]
MAKQDPPQLSESQYAAHRKELLALINQLRAVGAQGELDLPRITVIGNQSAGKSSVVEAISGIKVPRDAGTCTRCPMECRLSSSTNPWSCRISIRFEFDEFGRQLQTVAEQRFSETITDKNQVEMALRRAQLAVLNPSVGFAEILAMSAEALRDGIPDKQPLLFSRNVVCVDLEGPDLTDLYFLDLPGIIQNAEPEIVQLVEEMVVSHIRGNCLILVALPMTDDIENQKALRLAHQEDPEGRRTIGVMTKPDMLSAGSTKARDLWLDVIEGRRHTLHHGYYCTRQPDDAERSNAVTPTQARRAEAVFFAETAPWSTSSHKGRFGTDNLVSTLSTLLVQIINDRLPFIRQMANDRMEACRRELASLPEKIVGEPATHMLNLITAFCAEIRQYVDGQSERSSLIHERNAAFAAFRLAIRKTAPHFIARVPGQAGSRIRSPMDDEDGYAAEDMISTQKPLYLPDVREHIAKSITRQLPGNIPFEAKKSLITAFQQTWLSSTVECFDSVKYAMLALLMRCIDERFGRYELLQRRLKACIMELASRNYESCATFLTAILEVEQMPFTMNEHYLGASTEKWQARYKDQRAGGTGADEEPVSKRRKLTPSAAPTPFAKSVNVFKFGPRAPAGQPTSASDTTRVPTPFAVAPPNPHHAFDKGLSAFKAQGEASMSATATTADPDKINNILAQLAEIGYTGLTPGDFGKLRPVDEYETEINVMAEVRGYFQVAYKRVIDNIPALIDYKFLRALAQTLQQDIISEFGLGGGNANAVCSKFLAEDPRLVTRREDLISRRRRLEIVQAQLHNFGLHSIATEV